MGKVETFFSPKSVAIIGASRDSDKLGHQVLENLIGSGFKGKIYPVNPKTKSIHGLKVYSSVLDISGNIDLAVFVIPKEITSNVFEEVGKKKVKSAIIITAGFGETGKEGKEEEKKLLGLSKKYGTRIVGPNCLGVIDAHTPLNVSFAKNKPVKRNLTVVSQSGAMCTAILDWATKNNIGFSKFISLGNKIDVDESDIFPEFTKDKRTDVVLAYFEGISDGKEFIKKASQLTKKKPVIAIKAGASKAGSKAASSHTGALTTDSNVVNAAFRKSGVIKVNNIEELFDFSEVFSALPCPKDNKVAVLTNAGGPGVLTVDFISRSPLQLVKLSSLTKRKLSTVLPGEASISNPVDVMGDANAQRYQKAGEILFKDKNISSIVVILTPQTSTEIEKTAKALVALKKKYKKPIVASFIGGPLVEKGVQILEKGNVPNFEFPGRAVKALSELTNYKKYISTKREIEKKVSRNKKVEKIFLKVLGEKRNALNDKETKDVMKAIGVPTAKSRLVGSSSGAKNAAKALGYPVVMKIVSSDVLHKTEYGLVKTGIHSERDAQKAYSEIIKNAKKMKINYQGVMVYEMVKEGIELIIGSKKDKSFGSVLMFGLGGTLVELLKDTSHAISPISTEEAKNMIFSISGHKVLTGYRGKEGVDIKKVKDVLLNISDLVTAFPEIAELDINPVKADSKNVKALDIKIVLEDK